MSRPKNQATQARTPQRERGKLRVAALLEAAEAVFAEKGCDAATMTEIAARAGAPIGSLYQFFPNMEALADALLARYSQRVDDALGRIEERAMEMPIARLTDALLDLLVTFREERTAALTLIDSRRDSPARPSHLRLAMRRRIAGILRVRAPQLPLRDAENMAVVVLHLMKASAMLSVEEGLEARAEAIEELRHAARGYLMSRMGCSERYGV